MERYVLAIYVTLNQEQAIQHLFSTRGWQFLKADTYVLEDYLPTKDGTYVNTDCSMLHSSESLAPCSEPDFSPPVDDTQITQHNFNNPELPEKRYDGQTQLKESEISDTLKNSCTEGSKTFADFTEQAGSPLGNTEFSSSRETIQGFENSDVHVSHGSDRANAVKSKNVSTLHKSIHESIGDASPLKNIESSQKDETEGSKTVDKMLAAKNPTQTKSSQLKTLIAEGKLLSIKNRGILNSNRERDIGFSKQRKAQNNTSRNKEVVPAAKAKLKRQVFCSDCKVTFTSQKRYDSHRERNGGKCVFECDICGKVFLYRKSRYDLHMLSAHSTERPFKCDVCGKGYVTSDKLKIHRRIHTGEKPCVCEECGLSFYSRGDLANHREYHHTISTSEVKCEICNMTFCNKRYLTYHKNVTHSNQRSFHCHSCAKSFKTNSCLTRHLKYIHSDSKNYQCDTCDKCFKTAESLRKHKVRHVGERSFFCTECNKGFYERAELVQHYRTHSGERPYKCSLCDYRCAISGNLRKHYKTHASDRKPEEASSQNTFIVCG